MVPSFQQPFQNDIQTYGVVFVVDERKRRIQNIFHRNTSYKRINISIAVNDDGDVRNHQNLVELNVSTTFTQMLFECLHFLPVPIKKGNGHIVVLHQIVHSSY